MNKSLASDGAPPCVRALKTSGTDTASILIQRDSKKYLSQIPFTVKKQKPNVFRHDYWQPLCMIQFDAGQGVVGRNVFQKLREFRQLHELQWGWQAKEFKKLDKVSRGKKIHDQKPNAVADIAAVLAGAGRGNLMWTLEREPVPLEQVASLQVSRDSEKDVEEANPSSAASATSSTAKSNPATAETETKTESSGSKEEALPTTSSVSNHAKAAAAPPPSPVRRLITATIYWANDMDLDWARKWSENVIHEVGLPDGVKVWNWKTTLVRNDFYDAPGDNASENPGGSAPAIEAKKADGEEPKKGWLSWLGGKTGSSSQDIRA